jgi:hypothetical protein
LDFGFLWRLAFGVWNFNPGMSKEPDSTKDSPGVPGFRTWRGVYLFVFICFILTVLALTWFAHVFA